MILDGINWHVNTGEKWAVIGLNGSGKTTLLNMITGYLWPTRGSIDVFGHRYGECDIREIRKSIGWVSSSFSEQLPGNQKVIDIVISGKTAGMRLFEEPNPDDIRRAEDILRSFDCLDLSDKRYHQISQGEKQKVLISRALFNEPRLMILDEPCSGLDLYARESLLQYVESLDVPGLIYVTHHIEEILPSFTHVLMMKDGQILAAGKKEEVLTDEHLTEAYQVPINLTWSQNRPWVQVGAL
ncbi:MAG: ATP-binding cassette domain-containing protein [Bacillaceae bacterium]|nr:ATP-binding cassette domain-containing protein [Bacillaceae bacterium]